MESFNIDATSRTPALSIDPGTQTMEMVGESYPEDVRSFFGTITERLASYFEAKPTALTVNIKLTYFNSSSARALMELLDQFEDAASDETAITVNWYCDPDDDITREFAEDIASEVTKVAVNILDLDADQD